MSSTTVKLPAPREPPQPPVPVQCRQFFVLHPAFKQPTMILRWYASAVGPERNPNAPETYAFPCDIAVEACVIVARNKRGQLYRQESGSIGQKVTTSMILPGTYYFLLDGQDSSYRYKVCWEFKYWTPPAVIPSPWLFDDRTSDSDDLPFHFVPGETDPSQTVLEQDQECVMTGDTDLERLDSVHLIPPKEVSWYCNHGLQTLANDPSSASVDSYNNFIVLRHDLNGGGLNTGDFCFVPYRDSWVSLWMGPGSLGLASQHNFAQVELPLRVRARYLHSRFAWNVFHLIEVFLSQLLPERLKPLLVKKDRHSEYQRSDKDGEDDEDLGEEKEDENKGPASGTRSRSQKGGNGGKGKQRDRGSQSGHKSSRRRVSERGSDRPMKKKRRQNPNDIPDLSRIDPAYIERMERIDEQIPTNSDLGRSMGESHGFSRYLRLEYEYRQKHPAATDPGKARIALVSEREELKQFYKLGLAS